MRVHVPGPLAAGALLALPPDAARHVQVLRLQPGDPLTLFDGGGGEWAAQVQAMGRKAVQVQVLRHRAVERELAQAVTLAVVMPANDRMDNLVEKATELGASAIVPLMAQRSVLRLAGERAASRAAHWAGVAAAACEQCGRNRVPTVALPQPLAAWLAVPLPAGTQGLLLHTGDAPALKACAPAVPLALLSGPEGGFTDDEVAHAQKAGYALVSLGPRILRADTAPLAALALLALGA